MTVTPSANEAKRLTALREHNLLDTAPDAQFDDLVHLAAQICHTSAATVTLIDEWRQWYKAVTGLTFKETPRDVSFCSHTIQQTEPLIINDTHADPRFIDNPMVTGPPFIRFYAGVRLMTEDGYAIGALAVVDSVPHTLSAEEETGLRVLAGQAASLLKAARRSVERERLLADHARMAAIIDTAADAIYSITSDGIITSWNYGAEKLYGYAASEILGRHLSIIIPPEFRTEVDIYLSSLPDVHLETVRVTKEGVHKCVSVRGSRIVGPDGSVIGFSMIARDITERKQTENELAESRALLHESEQRLKLLTDAAFEGVAVSQNGFLLDVSPACATLFGYTSATEMSGLPVTQLVAPESLEKVVQVLEACDEASFEAAMQRKDGSKFYAEVRGRLIYIKGKPARIAALRDITDRKAMETALLDRAEMLRQNEARTKAILESISDAFYAFNPDWEFTYVNPQAEIILGHDYSTLLGRNVWEMYPDSVGSEFYVRFHTAVSHRIVTVFELFFTSVNSWFAVTAYPSENGLSVFLQNITERKRVEAEILRIAGREALINRISEEIRLSLDPEVIHSTAASLLAEWLNLERCFYMAFDIETGNMRLGHNWHRTGALSEMGDFNSFHSKVVGKELFSGGTLVLPDTMYSYLSSNAASFIESLGARAALAVPFYNNGVLIAALFATVPEPRIWTIDDVFLIEQVATLTRTALETARVIQREHNIAEQLQAALQPAIPVWTPGLNFADYYRAALEESAVGGDFRDVFTGNDGVTYMVLGDVSGKGLAAASHVATIRNMLRLALYSGESIADGITHLNKILLSQELVTGFATMFVGRYDANTKTLTFVNCGHDGAQILRRGTGKAEILPSTGAVLAGFAEAEYAEETVRLAKGDVITIFSDGLTEAGPSREEMLLADGVAQLLEQQAGIDDPAAIIHNIMTAVDSHRGLVASDDQCFLAAVVTD
jgi:PAS domain S-box-containing protein